MPVKKHAIILLSCIITFRLWAGEGDTLSRVHNFGVNPGNLSLFYHAPENAKQKKRALVVVLHGCSQGATAVAELSGWNTLADEYGFYVLYPQQHFPNNPSHCFNWFKNNEIEKGKGECESIREMIVYMQKNFPIDTQQTFVTGLSAGAAMAVVMISTQPSMFRAAAVFAGGPYKPGRNVFGSSASMIGWVDKTPDEWRELVWQQNPAFKGPYPKVLVYHGKNDPVVNFKNAGEIVEQWTALHKTDTIPDEIAEQFMNAEDVTRCAYKNDLHEEVVVWYKINDMGHALPVDPGYCNNQGGRKALFAKDKDFFSTYYTACEFGLIGGWRIAGPAEVSANEKNITFSLPALEGFTYEWSLPEGCEITGAKNTAQIKVNWGAKPGAVSVIEIGTNTCKYDHPALQVAVKQP